MNRTPAVQKRPMGAEKERKESRNNTKPPRNENTSPQS